MPFPVRLLHFELLFFNLFVCPGQRACDLPHLPVRTLHVTRVVKALQDFAWKLFVILSDHLVFKAVSSPTSQAPSTFMSTLVLLWKLRNLTSSCPISRIFSSNTATKLVLSPEKRNNKQFACGHWGFKADDHHKCMSCCAFHGSLCSKSLTCDICDLWNETMWEDYHGNLQILLFKKAISWRPQTLSHINLVLQDGGIIDASDSQVEFPLPSPIRLKSVAVLPTRSASTPRKSKWGHSIAQGDRESSSASPAPLQLLSTVVGWVINFMAGTHKNN